jgi:NADH-quinone oxidoreductase subunit E
MPRQRQRPTSPPGPQQRQVTQRQPRPPKPQSPRNPPPPLNLPKAKAAKPAKAAAESAKPAAAKPAATKPAATKAAKVVDPDAPAKPKVLKAARKGQADDLKKIEGIGPVMEKLCHELGFFHFDQIAAWTPQEVAWVDDNLKTFKGRVTRDKWVAQAKIIVEQGMEEFLRRAKTNDY